MSNTPLIKLECEETKNLSIYAKCEWHNPTGSIKDRAALGIINKYLQEADENKIFYSTENLPSKTVHVKHTVFDGAMFRNFTYRTFKINIGKPKSNVEYIVHTYIQST